MKAALSLLAASCLGLNACRDSNASPPSVSLIDGHWRGECTALTGPFAARLVRYTFEETRKVERRELYFVDAACTELGAAAVYSGSYTLEVTRQSYLYKIDLSYQDVAAEALSAAGEAKLEGARFCGIERWSPGEAQDIALRQGENCPAFGLVPIKNWNIVSIKRGLSLVFGTDIAHDNLRPDAVQADDATLRFRSAEPEP